MPSDIISLLQEARERVEKTKQAVKLAITFTADAEKDNDAKKIKGSKTRRAESNAWLDNLDREYHELRIAGTKRQLIDYTKNLNKLLEEAATYGGRTASPLKLQNDIERTEAIIAGLKKDLRELQQDS